MSNIRNAEIHNLQELIVLHTEIFRDSAGVTLGEYYIRDLFAWFILNDYSVFKVALEDDKIIGYIFGAPVGYGKELTTKLMPAVIKCLIKNPKVILKQDIARKIFLRIRSFLGYENKFPCYDLPKPIFSLVGIGVRKNYQQLGVGNELMKNFITCVKKENYNSIRLSVYKNNNKAIRFYENVNWESFPHSNDPELLHFGTILRDTDAQNR